MRNILLLFYLFGTACNSTREEVLRQKVDTVVNIPVIIDTNHFRDLTDFYSVTSVVSLKGEEDLLLSGALRYFGYKKHFYLVDRKMSQIYIIDTTGGVTGKLGCFGMKEGCYPTIEGFQIDKLNNELTVFTNRKKSILRFTLDGSFLEEIKLPFFAWDFTILDSLRFVFYLNQNFSDTTKRFNLIVTNRFGSVLQELYETKLPLIGFEYTGFLSKSVNRTLYSEPFSDTVFELSNGVISPKYNFDFASNSMPEILKKNKDSILKNMLKFSWLQEKTFETNNHVIFHYNENRKNKYLAFNKQSKKIHYSNQIDFRLSYAIFGNIIGSGDSTFYSLIDIDYLKGLVMESASIKAQLRNFSIHLFEICQDSARHTEPIILEFTLNF